MKLIKNDGFTLLEVLISLLLISFVLLGLDAIEVYSFRQLKIAYFFSLAFNQMNNMTERLSALHTYNGLDEQIEMWNRENQSLLPNGLGNVQGHFPHYIARIYWGNFPHLCIKNQMGETGCLVEEIRLA
ncbi:MAG: hypothetical protein ACD_60C00004G0005 [uncultured bacterium]|nr:MAG: hypothetical protein ACD_60C00004G0005 [uncultured bacterium]